MVTKDETLSSFVETFRANRQLTYDLVDALSKEDLHRKWPRPGLDTFAKHVAELAATERAFAEATHSGTMDFSTVPSVFDFPTDLSFESLRQEMRSADEDLLHKVASANPEQLVDWGDGTHLTLALHLTNLVAHEVFHQGMIAMMLYFFGIALPESWIINWAMPQVEPSEQSSDAG